MHAFFAWDRSPHLPVVPAQQLNLVLAKIHPAQWATLHNLACWSRHMQWSYIPFTINLVTGMVLSVQTLLLDKAAGYAWQIWSGDETIGQVETYNCTHTHVAYLFSVYISRFPASRWSCCHGRGCWSWGHRWEGGGGGGSRGGWLGVSYKFLILSQGRGRWGTWNALEIAEEILCGFQNFRLDFIDIWFLNRRPIDIIQDFSRDETNR